VELLDIVCLVAISEKVGMERLIHVINLSNCRQSHEEITTNVPLLGFISKHTFEHVHG